MRPNRLDIGHVPTGTPVDLKIERAGHHRKRLLDEIDAFREREPYLIREQRKDWQGRPYRVVTAYDAEQPPDCISQILGDFVNNLRSSLDHLVGQIRLDGPSKSSAFPICRRRTGQGGSFMELRQRKLAGIPNPAKKLIERMQPYDRRYGRPSRARVRWEALSYLETLWQVDKHRTILLATSLLSPDSISHNRTGEESSGIGHRFTPTRDEADWWLPIDDDDQTFYPKFTVQISLAKPRGFADDWPDIDGWELDGLVDYMYRTVVWDVVPHLSKFIQRAP